MEITKTFHTQVQGNSKCTIVGDTTKFISGTNPTNYERLITAVIEYPKIVDSEVLTHRMFARNSESKRAISYKRIRDQIGTDYFFTPIYGKEKKGMQDGGFLDSNVDDAVRELYSAYLKQTIKFTDALDELDVHHQMINRYLEPFITTCRIMTGTEFWWDYFISLRMHPDAEPHIQELGQCVKEALLSSESFSGDIHIPFHQDKLLNYKLMNWEDISPIIEDSVARCARISYHNYEKNVNITGNKIFIEKLWDNKHSTPFEHVAFSNIYMQPFGVKENNHSVYGDSWLDLRKVYGKCVLNNDNFMRSIFR